MTEEDNTKGNVNRRTVLQGVSAASAIGVLGTGSAAAKNNKPCFKDFECGDDADVYLKYEFDDDNCEFVLEKYEILDEETEFDPEDFTFQSAGNKEGEECEPIYVEWRSLEYEVTKVKAYGGTSCDGEEDLDDGVQSPYVFEPGLEAGESDQDAAISNIQFCLEERENGLQDLEEWQVDLIYGDPIFDFSAAGSYGSQDRLLQALDSCENRDSVFGKNDGEYADCEAEIKQDIETTGDGTATARLDPGTCDGGEFALVSYATESCDFDGGDDQVLVDSDEEGTADDDNVYTFEVDLP